MSSVREMLSVRGTVDYESGKGYRGGGRFQYGHALRKDDGYGPGPDSVELNFDFTRSDRSLRLEISEPLQLPDVIADLALAPPDEEQTAADLSRRLEFRDDLATAFEEAAAKLRGALRT